MTNTPSNTHHVATMELRDTGWVVIYGGTVVGRHRAKYKAREQVDQLNRPDTDS